VAFSRPHQPYATGRMEPSTRYTEQAVSARQLVLAYGQRVALTPSDFEIPSRSVTAVMGPNGSGKSTVLNAIAGLMEPASGALVVRTPSSERTAIAYVLQSTKVNEAMPVTVREVVAMGCYAHLGLFRPFGERDRRVCREAMERLDILDLITRHLDELSGGQRQRVFVAQGLAQQADLLLLDEPVTGLDLLSKETILAVVQEEKARGATVILTTHDLAEAAEADNVLLLSGRVIASGPPASVLTPEHLSDAYGVRLVGEEGGLMVDDAHHQAASGRHLHLRHHWPANHHPDHL
jgi:iron complex transport system ATP-binding protein